jgi:hypothetical protein
VEGTFRLGAEATLAALRGSEGTLSTVLLSIIDDPFIDLSSGHMSAMHKASFQHRIVNVLRDKLFLSKKVDSLHTVSFASVRYCAPSGWRPAAIQGAR